MFSEQAERTPSYTAVHAGDQSLTFEELERRSNQLSHVLRRKGVDVETPVGVFIERTVDLLVAILAIQKAGGAHVPLDPQYPPSRIAHMIHHSGIQCVVSTRSAASDLDFDGEIIWADERAIFDAEPTTAPETSLQPENLAYIIYTSGSTGAPKGVLVEHRQLANLFAGLDRVILRGEPGQEAWLSVGRLSFDISVPELFWTICRGITVVLHTPVSRWRRKQHAGPAEPTTGELLRDQRITHFQCTPSLASMLVEDSLAVEGLGRLRHWLIGGEPLRSSLAARMLETGAARISNMYGPTETTVWSTGATITDASDIHIGRPLLNQAVHVLDDRMQSLPPGVAGELYIAGAGVSRGYHRSLNLTAERFVELEDGGRSVRAYRTGDRVTLRHDGSLEYLGRADHQVKLRGHRIELGEIEAAICRFPNVIQAAVILRETATDQQLIAYIEARAGGGEPNLEQLESFCRGELPAIMVPAHFVRLDHLPLTPNGKIDRANLPAPRPEEMRRPTSSHDQRREEAPRDAIERSIAAMFEELLGYAPVAIDEDFFIQGGHSLLAVRLFAQLERDFNANLPLATLFEASTVRALADRIRGAPLQIQERSLPEESNDRRFRSKSRKFQSIVPIRSDGQKAPFFCVHGAGGNVLNFRDLSHHLAPGRAFYGLQARGVDGEERPHDSIEAMASDYLEELLLVQPEPPYLIGGYSGGGVIAFEMARQLSRSGREVAALVLLDSFTPGITPQRVPLKERMRGISREGPSYILKQLERRMNRHRNERRVAHRLDAVLRAGATVPIELRDAWLTRNFERIAPRYRLTPWSGPAFLYRTEGTNPYFGHIGFELGWRDVLPSLQVTLVPGNHDSIVLEPNVTWLASHLNGLMADLP